MSPPKILVTQPIHPEVAARLSACGELAMNRTIAPWSAQALRSLAADAAAMMGFMTDRVDADLLASAPRLRIVACALKGFDSYDVDACTARSVWVSIVPDLLTAPTAELAIGLAISLARNLRSGDAYVRSGAFRGWRAHLYGMGLADSTVAVLGLGKVGRAIIDRLAGFGCRRILGIDPSGTDPRVTMQSLDEAIAIADYLFVAVPLSATAYHLIDHARLASCKPGQSIINVGRGSVVDESAVADALAKGRLAGYAADVFELEDWALPNNPVSIPPALLDHPNTVFTPHLGSAVREVRLAIEHRAADNILAVLRGEDPPDAINRLDRPT